MHVCACVEQYQLALGASEGHVNPAPISEQFPHVTTVVVRHKREHDTLFVPPLEPVNSVGFHGTT